MTQHPRSLHVPALVAVVTWLLAPWRDRSAPEPLRPRTRRRLPWVGGVAAVPVLLWFVDTARLQEVAAGGPLEASVVGALLVLVLLVWHPLTAWRLAAVTTAGWWLVAPTPQVDFAVPTNQLLVLVVASLVVLGRHRRDLGWAVWVWTVLVLPLGVRGGSLVGVLVVLPLLTLLVDARRQRTRARAEAVSERQARLTREAESLVLEERTRIARELHDVVAHHMSMVAVQAETAQYRLGGLDAPARDEFASIAGSARAALDDVRGILRVLRDADGGPETAPQPGLDGLEALVETARAAGASVGLTITGRRRPLSAALEIGGYRIVQESLANAARHAPGATTAVTVAYRRRELEVTVVNGPPAVPVPSGGGDGGGGHGLVGMRERAHLLDGDVTAGPTDDGGFRVVATLPVKEAPA